MNLDFLSQDDDWTSLSIEEMVILLWHNQRRPNQTPPDPLPYIWFLLGGRGCVAEGTRIYNPILNKHQKVEERTPGQPEDNYYVLALDPATNETSIQLASPSYLKGEAPLFNVQTDTLTITTTAEHKFLSLEPPLSPRWLPLRLLAPGATVATHTGPQTVRTITPLHDHEPRPFYDLTVPVFSNYLANGFFNHNSGKTLTGANHVFEYCKNLPNTPENRIVRGALISETLGDVKLTMIEGATGLRSIVPKSLELKYNRSLGEYSFFLPGPPYREVYLKAFSSQTPDQLRGPQHHIVWLDEPAKCQDSDENPEGENTTWSNLEFGLRLGTHPHVVVTGTPTPCKLVKFLKNHEDSVVVAMSSLENLDNLPESQRKKFERLNPNSRTYQQEVMARILEDNPDSQFDQTTINHYRKAPPETEEFPPDSGKFRPVPQAKILGWDPSMTSNEESDECGLILALKTQEHDELHKQRTYTHTHAYILEDYSGHFSPAEQALKVVDIILNEQVEELVFEQNQGADFIMTLLQTALKGHKDMKDLEYNVKELRKKKTRIGPITRWRITTPIHTFIVNGIHAKQGKVTRAETASLAYENGDVHHPLFPLLKLEEQMVGWNPLNTKKSPDRLDAVVYTLLHIFGFEGALTAPRHGKLVKPEGKNIGTGVDILTGTIPNREKPSRYAELYSGDMRSRPGKSAPLNPQDPERFLRDILQDRGKG